LIQAKAFGKSAVDIAILVDAIRHCWMHHYLAKEHEEVLFIPGDG
jgi:hypothetical protein